MSGVSKVTMETVRSVQTAVTDLVTGHPALVVTGACVTSLTLWLSRRLLRPKPRPTGPPDTLVVFARATGTETPSLSPYLLKLETFLKIAKIPYVMSNELVFSSKGKIPWISYNGQEIADTHFCIQFLTQQFGVDLNQRLSTEQKAVAHAFRVTMDEFHFWCNAYFRYYAADDPVLKRFVPSRLARVLVKRRFAGLLHSQGLGRHTDSEVLQLFQENLRAVEEFLGEKTFMMGDTPTEVDCSVFAMLSNFYFYTPAQIVNMLGENFLQNKYPKLYQYILKMKSLTYPDYVV